MRQTMGGTIRERDDVALAKKLVVKSETGEQWCPVCHLSDCWDIGAQVCTRCQGITEEAVLCSTIKQLQDKRQVNEDKNRQLDNVVNAKNSAHVLFFELAKKYTNALPADINELNDEDLRLLHKLIIKKELDEVTRLNQERQILNPVIERKNKLHKRLAISSCVIMFIGIACLLSGPMFLDIFFRRPVFLSVISYTVFFCLWYILGLCGVLHFISRCQTPIPEATRRYYIAFEELKKFWDSDVEQSLKPMLGLEIQKPGH